MVARLAETVRSRGPPILMSGRSRAILSTVPERPRWIAMTWAAVCLWSFAVLTLLVAVDWPPLVRLDDRGQPASEWAVSEPWLDPILRWIEVAFGTVSMAIATAVLALILLIRRQRRAAAYAVGVMICTALATTLIKIAMGRARPDWQHPAGFLENNAFPSGHVSCRNSVRRNPDGAVGDVHSASTDSPDHRVLPRPHGPRRCGRPDSAWGGTIRRM